MLDKVGGKGGYCKGTVKLPNRTIYIYVGAQAGGFGGGGGYYAGGSGNHVGGSGGSSFISGHSGCDAIKESSTENAIVHTGQPNHYSGLVFTDTQMIDGAHTMPSPKGGLEAGHLGDGACIVTQLSFK